MVRTREDAAADEVTRWPDEILVGFAHALRASGVPVTQDRTATFLAAVAELDLYDPAAVYRAGRATLCAGRDDLLGFDRVFARYFSPSTTYATEAPAEVLEEMVAGLPVLEGSGEAEGEPDQELSVMASAADVLRHRDIAAMTDVERQLLAGMIAMLPVRLPLRRSVRRQAARRGSIDGRRTMRAALRHLGEPPRISFRERARVPRRLVFLIDVSGSMEPYAESLVRLAHRYSQGARMLGGAVETFTLGSRLTPITRALRLRDPERALIAAGDAVPDWSGGTRLGETIGAFNDRWGRRGVARGSVVVVFSDGWECGDPQPLAEQAAQLSRLAHRVVWVNPHRGKEGYQPIQQGVRAVLPYCDAFLAGHSLATFVELGEVISEL